MLLRLLLLLHMLTLSFPLRHPACMGIRRRLQQACLARQATAGFGTNSHELRPVPVIVGIAGGSASGKTTFAKAIIEELGDEHISLIGHDNYYKDLQHIAPHERSKVNFDHPDSLDTELLCSHLIALKAGSPVAIPTYDFTTNSRAPAVLQVNPSRIVIVDGILLFSDPSLLKLMDMKIFVDTDDDIRLIRRIQRDTAERGRQMDQVIQQYLQTVRPMHQTYVEPSKRRADIIVPAGQGIQPVALHMCVSRLREIISLR